MRNNYCLATSSRLISSMDPEHQATLDDDVAFPTSVISDSSDYVLSINPSETERLRMQHDVVKDAMGGRLVLAPIDLTMPGLRILDSATADGESNALLS